MKEYMKPEIEYIDFSTEEITDGVGSGTDVRSATGTEDI